MSILGLIYLVIHKGKTIKFLGPNESETNVLNDGLSVPWQIGVQVVLKITACN